MRCAGFGGPDEQLLVGVGADGQRVPVQGQFAGDRVVERFGAGTAGGYQLVGLPKLVVAHGQFADQRGEFGVLRVIAASMRTWATAAPQWYSSLEF